MFKSKYMVRLLDENWELLKNDIPMVAIPKQDELMYIEEYGVYFKIIYVIHNITSKHDIILVIRKLNKDIKD